MCRLWLSGGSLPQTTQHVNSQASDSRKGRGGLGRVENEKSGSKALTSVNMSVTLSLKVCQRSDQADKPGLRAKGESVTPQTEGA